MKTVLLASIALAIAAGCAQADPKHLSCPGMVDGGGYSDKIDQFYAERAVAIVRAGLKNDTEALGPMVAPNAEFSIWRGDSGTGRRKGVLGLLEMVRNLKPTRFENSSRTTGPFTIAVKKCEWDVTVIFHTEQPGIGVTMTFEFADGVLMRAHGTEMELFEGDVR